MATRGQKRHLVSLRGPDTVLVPDGDGGYTETPVALSPADVYAEIKPATARDLERTIANAVQSNASHVVTIDYHPAVNTKTQVVFGTRVLKVTGVQNPEERNVELVLVCSEIVA